jgi:hypothetical protein
LHELALQELQQYRNHKYITTHKVVNNNPAVSSSSAAAIVASLVKSFPVVSSVVEEGMEPPKAIRKSRFGASTTPIQPLPLDLPLVQPIPLSVIVKEKTLEEKAEEEYERLRDIRLFYRWAVLLYL